MDPTYILLLIFLPVPVMLLGAIIAVIYDRKKPSELNIHHLTAEKIPARSPGPENQRMEQPSAS